MPTDKLSSVGRKEAALTPAQARAVDRAMAASVRARARSDAQLRQRLNGIINGGAPAVAVARHLGIGRSTLYEILGVRTPEREPDDDSQSLSASTAPGSAGESQHVPSAER